MLAFRFWLGNWFLISLQCICETLIETYLQILQFEDWEWRVLVGCGLGFWKKFVTVLCV